MKVYRDERNSQGVRIEAAKAAAPYLHIRLAPAQDQGNGIIKIEVTGGLPD